MNQKNVIRFIRTSELYLRITEQKRSATNIDEIVPMLFYQYENQPASQNSTQAAILADSINTR
jgi:hypothetical protein